MPAARNVTPLSSTHPDASTLAGGGSNTHSGVSNTRQGVLNTHPGVSCTHPGVYYAHPGVSDTCAGVSREPRETFYPWIEYLDSGFGCMVYCAGFKVSGPGSMVWGIGSPTGFPNEFSNDFMRNLGFPTISWVSPTIPWGFPTMLCETRFDLKHRLALS